jgi:hypothetical protein
MMIIVALSTSPICLGANSGGSTVQVDALVTNFSLFSVIAGFGPPNAQRHRGQHRPRTIRLSPHRTMRSSLHSRRSR